MSKNSLKIAPTPTLEGPIQTRGQITDVEAREVTIGNDTVTYADFTVKNIQHPELAQILTNGVVVGFPARINAETKLGRFLKRMGINPDEEVDLMDLIGSEVAFFADKHDGSDGGRYWRIDRDTLQPAK